MGGQRESDSRGPDQGPYPYWKVEGVDHPFDGESHKGATLRPHGAKSPSNAAPEGEAVTRQRQPPPGVVTK